MCKRGNKSTIELSTQSMKKRSTESYKKNWLGPARKIEEGVWESSFHNRVWWCPRTLENRMTSKQEQWLDLEEVNRSQAWCWARECRLDDTSNKEESTKKVAQHCEMQSWRKATSCLGRRKWKPRSRHWTATSSKGEHLLSRRGKQNEKTSDRWSRRGQVR